MELYGLYLLSFGLLALISSRWRARWQAKVADLQDAKTLDEKTDIATSEDAISFRRVYFIAYTLVLAADWLQGPYIYSVYKEDHGLSEHTIAVLFGTGFVTAGVTASFAGALADRYGRRKACFAYCGATALSCLLLLVKDSLSLLFLGRALGGLSSTLLYTVFETWMVAEHTSRGLSAALRLSDMFSWSASLSGAIAIAAGSIGEVLVQSTGARSSPFMVAVVCLIGAGIYMRSEWPENYGHSGNASPTDEEKQEATIPSDGVESERQDDEQVPWKQLVPLFAATTAFEGSMYLFVFIWTPALTTARTSSGSSDPLPLGLIFSCFMCAMVMGSTLFSLFPSATINKSSTLILAQTLAVAACALLAPVIFRTESLSFWSFAVFEMCVGMYYPLMGKLKSDLVKNNIRAKVYAWMRLPLNVFVFTTLTLIRDWDKHRNDVLTFCGAFLIVASFILHRTAFRSMQATT